MPTTPTQSLSGIQQKDDARVIPMSRRADGSVRKERRVRPGYVPPEDVAKYSNRVLDAARPSAAPNSSLSSSSPLTTISPAAETPKSKSQLKNEKRKAKRKEEQSSPISASNVSVSDSLSASPPKQAGADQIATEATTTSNSTVHVVGVTTTTESSVSMDPEKKLRALNKKLRQAEQLKERMDKGETMLPEQLEKVSKMDELQAQIAELSI
ncbi:hypothetical protein BX616_003920 [Lobosporangium transversale]|uniref:WIBG Mago-binding domain-containing protein n=1 Tax=Lobosporangium transversale TaxID=64571 RepID=A0A1Y2GQ09_9FUNG|nr:hypothetical protein BCR41DRAFT_355182 [Lobosporangium transversale]KAF9916369.1 hypothetical protein BX616_003920 [Lobosporangium transversale]ORZ13919.1 hypothetical protein BCR41DRAFT_355182 [Lobosporangium transversale]|eukprot:XP_021880703.1 hypothetical protein BCR41DRAFT_355182 [Lobosporangium transversale]